MVNKDERYIKNRFGKDNHFVVPDGYFESITSQVMENIAAKVDMSQPAQRPLRIVEMSSWQRYRKAVIGVAASVCVAMLSLGVYFHAEEGGKQKPVAKQENVITPSTDYSTLDAAVDYSMMDSEDMYAYMADLN